jgi:hypothetical protein
MVIITAIMAAQINMHLQIIKQCGYDKVLR